MDWDEVRYFLAVAREGSVRAASDRLGVKHTTVLRRIAQLEKEIGTQLFEKLPTGYRLTSSGEEVVQFAEDMETASNRMQMRVFGRDQAVGGQLRVTMAPLLASNLFMPDILEYARIYPDVEIELLSSDEPVNLTNREAEVAIRVVYDRDTLPQNLHGIKGPPIFSGVYMSHQLLSASQSERKPVRWIIKNRYGHPEWSHRSDIPTSKTMFKTTDAAAQLAAVRQGFGVTLLPCFVGDVDPLLTRVPGSQIHLSGTLWLLTHGDTRKTKRVQLFNEFLSHRISCYQSLLAGRHIR